MFDFCDTQEINLHTLEDVNYHTASNILQLTYLVTFGTQGILLTLTITLKIEESNIYYNTIKVEEKHEEQCVVTARTLWFNNPTQGYNDLPKKLGEEVSKMFCSDDKEQDIDVSDPEDKELSDLINQDPRVYCLTKGDIFYYKDDIQKSFRYISIGRDVSSLELIVSYESISSGVIYFRPLLQILDGRFVFKYESINRGLLNES